ncbi:MAG: tyrosine-type recombinase/integrase [Bacillota bacterium]
MNLKVDDINFSSNTTHIKITKTKAERYVFFTRTTKLLLKKLIHQGVDNQYIFIYYTYKKRLTVDNVQKICYRLKKRLNLKDNINPHKWRHTFATNFLKNGGNLESLRILMGHTNLKTTQIYLHIDKEFLHKEYFNVNS